MIDIYCERTGPDFWSEPINALTNLAFIIAALVLFFQARQTRTLDLQSGILIALIFVIGVGSGLFHTFATPWAAAADVIPILLFQIAFLLIYSRLVIKASAGKTAVLVAGYIVLTIISGFLPRELFNGTLRYAPAFIYVLGFGVYHYLSKQEKPWILLLASGIFLVSMTFRSVDEQVCESFPLGTHFLWHVLNAVVLYLCTSTIIEQKKASKTLQT